jgi:hypothetical protein
VSASNWRERAYLSGIYPLDLDPVWSPPRTVLIAQVVTNPLFWITNIENTSHNQFMLWITATPVWPAGVMTPLAIIPLGRPFPYGFEVHPDQPP